MTKKKKKNQLNQPGHDDFSMYMPNNITLKYVMPK